METLFTWLHLSDLHVRAPEPPGPDRGYARKTPTVVAQDRVLAALRQDVADLGHGVTMGAPPPNPRSDSSQADALIVSGDISRTGALAELVAARRWLAETASAVGLGPERVFVVPGNHDVERDAAARNEGLELRLLADLREGRRRLDLALEKPAARSLLEARLAAYSELAFAFGPRGDDSVDAGQHAGPHPRSPAHGASAERLSWSYGLRGRGGLRMRFTGINTAWLSMDDADHGELRLGMAQLEHALASIASTSELVVIVAHHPLRGGWLADERDADAWMGVHAHVILTGHAHDAAAEQARAGAGGSCVWVAAGASPEGGDGSRTLGWSLGQVLLGDDGDLALRVTPRCWSSRQQRFVPDERVLRDGRAFAEHPLRHRVAAAAGRGAPVGARRAVASKTVSTLPPPIAPVHSPQAETMAGPLRLPAPPPAPRVNRPPPVFRPDPRSADSPERLAARLAETLPPPSFREPPPPSFPPPVAQRRTAHFEGPGALPAFAVPYFVGRTEEMAALRAALTTGSVASNGTQHPVTCLVATGLGGVGKTSLVQHFVATEARSLFDESVWVDARDLLAELGRAAKRFGWQKDERAPTVEEAGAFLRQAIESARVLLVIDNVDHGMARVGWFPVPSAASKSRLVVTSRIVTLHEELGRLARPLRLGTWDDATCRAHFREVVPALSRAPDADLDRLSRRVGGLPLAVRLLAKQLLRPGLSPETLFERLDREPLAALDGAGHPRERGERTIAATFQAALDGLGAPVLRVLLALAACAPATRASVVAAVAGVQEEDASLALEGLSEQSLVEWLPDAEQPFRLHDVVRLLLASLPGASDAEHAHDAWALATVAANAANVGPHAWMDLDREVSEVLAVVERRLHRGDGPGAWEALSPILGALDRRGMYGELVSTATRVLALIPPDTVEEALVLGNLGLAWCSLGDVAKATDAFERALVTADERAFTEGQALALSGLGRCYGMRGEWDTSIAHVQRAITLHEQLGLRRAVADDLGNLGLAYRRTKDVPRAIEYLRRALPIYEELDQPDGRAEVLGGLGLCYRDGGELATAVDYFARALAIHEALERPGGQATMLGNLGNTYRMLHDTDRAIEHLERALAIYERLGLLEGQGAALGNLGTCYRAKGDKVRARANLENALVTLHAAGLGQDHPHVKMVVSTLAKMAREQERLR